MQFTRPVRGPARLYRRLLEFLGPTGEAARQTLTALVLNSTTSFVAGLVLAGAFGAFRHDPELLILVPPAIGLRGNIFGSLGNRLATSIHAGTFHDGRRLDGVVGQNLLAALVLTGALSFILALIAHAAALAFGLPALLGVGRLALVSVLGGTLASAVVGAATIGLAVVGVRREWDLDNLVAPTVSTLGDVITVPALWLAAIVARTGSWATAAGWALGVLSGAAMIAAVRSRREMVRQIVRESWPVLTAAASLSTLGGLVMAKQTASLNRFPALLILLPAFVSSVGALGGVLASRLTTKLHLGLAGPDTLPGPDARADFGLIAVLALPIMIFNATGAHLVGLLAGRSSPGAGAMVMACLLAGTGAVLVVFGLAYYSTVAAWRFDVDPDSYGVPTVTAGIDFVGSVALVVALSALGVFAR